MVSFQEDVRVFCPKCNKYSIERIRRSSFIKTVLFWLPLKHYKCFNCL